MAQYRTAQGKTLDMSSLASRNEKTRAVGNMKVNARGDTIDAHGKIIEPVTSRATKQYSKTVGNKSARPSSNANKVKPDEPQRKNVVEEKLPTEEDFDSEDDLEIEKIKEQETKAKK